MAKDVVEIIRDRLVLVEGDTDVHFFERLLVYMGIVETVQVLSYGGNDKLSTFVKVLPNLPNFANVKAVGIVRDADDSLTNTFQSICAILKQTEFVAPARPLLLESGSPSVVVMVMPGTIQGRMLEDLCLSAFANDPALPCVDEYFSCLNVTGIVVNEYNLPKVKLRTLLFSKNQGELQLRHAVGKDWWPWDHLAFDEVKTFVRLIAGLA